MLEVVVPGTKMFTPVYNIYVHPPMANQELLNRWRKWISAQKFYADYNGVGIRYQHPFCCNHCKTVDHPRGLCTYVGSLKKEAAPQGGGSVDDDDLLPASPTPGPSQLLDVAPHTGRQGGRKGKERENPLPRAGRARMPVPIIQTGGMKKRRLN